tara:strand:- start:679 stop:1125 length:447 start_codon:yes stop_codon:yes gene_type:complete
MVDAKIRDGRFSTLKKQIESDIERNKTAIYTELISLTTDVDYKKIHKLLEKAVLAEKKLDFMRKNETYFRDAKKTRGMTGSVTQILGGLMNTNNIIKKSPPTKKELIKKEPINNVEKSDDVVIVDSPSDKCNDCKKGVVISIFDNEQL